MCKLCGVHCRYEGDHPTTVHGIKASPRLARLYLVMHNAGINLTDFSTDQCVRGVLAQLRTLLSAVEGGKPVEGLTEACRLQYAEDLKSVMSRVPEGRVTEATKTKFVALKEGTPEDAADKTGGWW